MSTGPAVRWSGTDYGANNAHHRTYDSELLATVPVDDARRILDLGCGTGELSRRLATQHPSVAVVAVDPDPALVAAARNGAPPNLQVEQHAAQQLDDVFPPATFDGVISIAVLHWIPEADQPVVARAVRRILRPGGWFRADFVGSGQIERPRQLLDALAVRCGGSPAPWYFPTAEKHRAVIEAAGLSVADGWIERHEQRRPFDLEGARGWLASQVSIAYLPGIDPVRHSEFLAAVESEVLPALRRADGTYDQDYVRIDLLAHAV